MAMKKSFYILLVAASFTACKKETGPDGNVTVFSAGGDITVVMDAFRSQLGSLNTAPGATGGRREVNWDGVPDSLNGIKLPNDFFNPTGAGAPTARQRGLLYAGPSDAMVSQTGFAEINAQAASAFGSFSGTKTFAVVNATEWPVEFRVAGQNTLAGVKGFGLVAADVDKPNTTYVEFFNGGRSLGKYYFPVRNGSSAFSFVGVYFANDLITQATIGHEGRLSDGGKDISEGGTKDLVVFDDFIYGEPVAR
jgi:hypothetical protein